MNSLHGRAHQLSTVIVVNLLRPRRPQTPLPVPCAASPCRHPGESRDPPATIGHAVTAAASWRLGSGPFYPAVIPAKAGTHQPLFANAVDGKRRHCASPVGGELPRGWRAPLRPTAWVRLHMRGPHGVFDERGGAPTPRCDRGACGPLRSGAALGLRTEFPRAVGALLGLPRDEVVVSSSVVRVNLGPETLRGLGSWSRPGPLCSSRASGRPSGRSTPRVRRVRRRRRPAATCFRSLFSSE